MFRRRKVPNGLAISKYLCDSKVAAKANFPFCKHCQNEIDSIAHIQYWCTALQKPRIAAHHCIWRELQGLIAKHSTDVPTASGLKWKLIKRRPTSYSSPQSSALLSMRSLIKAHNGSIPTTCALPLCERELQDVVLDIGDKYWTPIKDSSAKWVFPTSLGNKKHVEWTAEDILRYILPDSQIDLHHHAEQALASNNDNEEDINTLLRRRPDGIAVLREMKTITLLEFTRPMDDDEDWHTKTNDKKMNRYKMLRKLLELAAPDWSITQINFSIGVRGSILTPEFGKALSALGVPIGSQAPIIRDCSRRTLEMHELLLKSYYCAKFSRPEWLATDKLVTVSRAVSHTLYLQHVRQQPSS